MLATTEGIVLHFINYGENSLIAHIYTKEFGRQTFILKSVRSKKSRNSAGMLQPLYLVDLVCYQKQTREIQLIKEIKNIPAYQNIPFHIVKLTQAIFIAEVLFKTLREQESSPPLFDFMKNAFLYFDLMEGQLGHFHLWFLFRLTEYLGFLPDLQNAADGGWFDLRRGTIEPVEPSHPYFINKEATHALSILAKLKIKELPGWKISRNLRGYLTAKLVEYYQFRFENLGEIKSLKVLNEVFA